MPYEILRINTMIHLDPILVESMKHLFDWANQAGLKGIAVSGLKFIEPRPDLMKAEPIRIYCLVEQENCSDGAAWSPPQQLIQPSEG